jgi:ABC-type bacteriocin/lantibiotic exporter with double-glycine peptidase domain
VALTKAWHDLAMSDLERRSGSRPSRRQREQRAYNLVLAGGALTVVFVVTAVLAIVGVMGWSIPILAAILAVVCGVLFRRTVRP